MNLKIISPVYITPTNMLMPLTVIPLRFNEVFTNIIQTIETITTKAISLIKNIISYYYITKKVVIFKKATPYKFDFIVRIYKYILKKKYSFIPLKYNFIKNQNYNNIMSISNQHIEIIYKCDKKIYLMIFIIFSFLYIIFNITKRIKRLEEKIE